MNTEDLEKILSGAEETDTLEFKAANPWSLRLFVRDILAMANVLGGGRIVVGVENETFARQGLTQEQADSYVYDEMRDGIAPFADPRAIFRMYKVHDAEGLLFVVIDVASFEDVPVICRQDGHDVNAGAIYFRSRSRRPESARVNNSVDMRDMVERAAVLSARRLRRLGYVPNVPQGPDYDAELGDLR